MKDRLIRFACYFVKNKEKFIPFNVKIPSRKTKRAKAGSVRGKFDLKKYRKCREWHAEREREVMVTPQKTLTSRTPRYRYYIADKLSSSKLFLRAPFEHRETIVLAPRKSRDDAIGRETRRCSRFHRNHRPRKFMRSGTANLSSSPVINMKQRKPKDVQATMRREK